MGLAAAGAGLSAVGGIVKSIKGAKQAKRARNAINSYRRQELDNVYEDLEVSTLGADFQAEQLARATATSVQALQTGGARALIGGIGAVQEQNVVQSRQIGADLDRQRKQIDQLEASDNIRIQNQTERREEADLAGLGQQLSVGDQNFYSGLGDIAQSFGALGRLGAGSGAVGSGSVPTTNPLPAASTNGNPYGTGNPYFTVSPSF